MNVDLRTDRGAEQLAIYVTAMSHELMDNGHKGDWTDAGDETQLGELLYHVAKLGLAVKTGDPAAILEYAADVGNHAWMIADAHDALNGELLHPGPIEYDPEHDIAKPSEFVDWKRSTEEWAKELLG